MLVYGDRARIEDPRAKLDAIEAAWAVALRAPPGLDRHGALVAAFVEASELAQGLADLEFEAAGEDDATPLQQAAMGVLMAMARTVGTSWRGEPDISRQLRETRSSPSGRGGPPEGWWSGDPLAPSCAGGPLHHASHGPPLPEGEERAFHKLPPLECARLRALLPESHIRARQAEGHAFYAVYPEAYFEAARALPPSVRFIGLRSIGAGLAAMAAVAAGAEAPVTLRPVGPPSRRQVRPSRRLRTRVADARAETWAVVDEGPGLSGSSFGATADWLEAEGVARARIVFLPGHAGAPGPQADPAHARRWAGARRLTVDFDTLIRDAHGACPPLDRWFADHLGEAIAPLEDLSAGAWRARRFGDQARWPAAYAAQERRKYLLRTERGTWLLKFAGLGRDGAAKFDRAEALHRAGFGVEPAGLRHGFLAERWRDDARPLAESERPPLERLGAYLRFRAAAFPAEAPGASLAELVRMARVNAEEALGARVAARLAWTDAEIADLQRSVRPVLADGRLHRWEWLRAPDGRLLKTDALDHACAHDLVGAQDLAWDLAGAAAEFDLSEDEQAGLLALCGYDSGAGRALFVLLSRCYLAFQLGLWTFAATADPDAGRTAVQAARYAQALERLACTGAPRP